MKLCELLVCSVFVGSGLGAGCKAPAADNTAKPANVTEVRVQSESAAGTNWLLNGRTFDEAHFSPLKQITDKNVNSLGLAWYLDIDGAMGVVAEPIVVDAPLAATSCSTRSFGISWMREAGSDVD